MCFASAYYIYQNWQIVNNIPVCSFERYENPSKLTRQITLDFPAISSPFVVWHMSAATNKYMYVLY